MFFDYLKFTYIIIIEILINIIEIHFAEKIVFLNSIKLSAAPIKFNSYIYLPKNFQLMNEISGCLAKSGGLGDLQ